MLSIFKEQHFPLSTPAALNEKGPLQKQGAGRGSIYLISSAEKVGPSYIQVSQFSSTSPT